MTTNDRLGELAQRWADTAKPDRETIKTVAECVNCWQMLQKVEGKRQWFHVGTGLTECK